MGVNRKDKFLVYSAITGAIQRLEKLSRANYINKTELEACLLAWSTLSSLVLFLPASEHNIWVREMTVAGLDFRNPVGLEILIVCASLNATLTKVLDQILFRKKL